MYYSELTTVNEVRSAFLLITGTGDDTLMLDEVRAVSREIARAAKREFVPRIETRYYDPLRDRHGATLLLDSDLLSVTTLTNGDTIAITASQYNFEPNNATPYWGIKLLASSGLVWTYQTDPENAISLVGVWGCDLGWSPSVSTWVNVDTLSAAITTTTATSATTTGSALLKAGYLIKIDSEYIYVSSVATTTATIVRGVNGSTAAAHLINAPISYWRIEDDLAMLARECVAARYRLRNNPLAESFIAADGTTFTSPKDVGAYIIKRVIAMGLVRN